MDPQRPAARRELTSRGNPYAEPARPVTIPDVMLRMAAAGLLVVVVGDVLTVGAGWLGASYLAGVTLWTWTWREYIALRQASAGGGHDDGGAHGQVGDLRAGSDGAGGVFEPDQADSGTRGHQLSGELELV